MKIMLSVSVSLAFSHNVHNIRFEQQIRILSELTVIDLGPPKLESSIRISKFYNPTHSELKFHKARIENWLSIGFELGSPWLRTINARPYSTYSVKGSLKVFILIFTVLEQSWRPFASLKLCKCSQNPHPASRVASNLNKNQPLFAQSSTNTPHTLTPQSLLCRSNSLKRRNNRNKKWNSSTR